MNEQLVKSLTSLIDETIAEIEDLKKSRFSAAEIQLSGPGDGIASLQPSGELEAGKPAMQKDEEDKDEEDKDEDKEEEAKKAEDEDEEEEEEEAKKGEDCEETKKAEWEGVLKEADKKKTPKQSIKKGEDEEDEDEEKKDMEKYEGINRDEAAPQKMPEKSKSESTEAGVNRSVAAAPQASKSSKSSSSSVGINRSASPRDSKSEKTPSPKMQPSEGYEVKKSSEETDSLTKSYVDEKLGGLEKKISSLFDMIKQIGDQPMPPKGVPAGVAPLKKSTTESLSKAELASKLFELKKSGTRVDSADIASIELGQDFSAIVNKYNLR